MKLLVQLVVLLAAAASLLAVLLAALRVLRCVYRSLRARRYGGALDVTAAFVGLLGLLGLAVVAWLARAVAHSAKSLGGDVALAAATTLPLLVAAFAVWRLASRVERGLGNAPDA